MKKKQGKVVIKLPQTKQKSFITIKKRFVIKMLGDNFEIEINRAYEQMEGIKQRNIELIDYEHEWRFFEIDRKKK